MSEIHLRCPSSSRYNSFVICSYSALDYNCEFSAPLWSTSVCFYKRKVGAEWRKKSQKRCITTQRFAKSGGSHCKYGDINHRRKYLLIQQHIQYHPITEPHSKPLHCISLLKLPVHSDSDQNKIHTVYCEHCKFHNPEVCFSLQMCSSLLFRFKCWKNVSSFRANMTHF